MTSEVGGISYDGDRVRSGASKSAPPPGMRFGRRDLRDLSLAEFWASRFASVRGDTHRLEFFLYLAEADLRRAKARVTPRDPHESLEVRASRIVDQYEGLSPIEAAVAEDSTEVYIRAIRANNGRDAETGWPC